MATIVADQPCVLEQIKMYSGNKSPERAEATEAWFVE